MREHFEGFGIFLNSSEVKVKLILEELSEECLLPTFQLETSQVEMGRLFYQFT